VFTGELGMKRSTKASIYSVLIGIVLWVVSGISFFNYSYDGNVESLFWGFVFFAAAILFFIYAVYAQVRKKQLFGEEESVTAVPPPPPPPPPPPS
jgi:hypothetical protein